MGKIYTSVEQLIGGTPLLELTRITKHLHGFHSNTADKKKQH